jgi:hypothetical protein
VGRVFRSWLGNSNKPTERGENKKMNHPCGCKTETVNQDGKEIIVISPCKEHEVTGWVWIALKHKKEGC